MRIRTDKIKRDVRIRKDEVFIDLEATDVLPKKDFIELYDNRIKEKTELEERIRQYKEHLQKVKGFEGEEGIKDIVKMIEKDDKIAQKIYAVLQKKMLAEQIQAWEKMIEGIGRELSDLGDVYKRLKEEIKDGNKKS